MCRKRGHLGLEPLGNKYDDDSTLPQIISEGEMDAMSSGNAYESEPMSKDMLEDISDGSQFHPIINRRESRYKIRDRIKQGQSEWKGEFSSIQNMGKVLHNIFKAMVNKVSQALPILV